MSKLVRAAPNLAYAKYGRRTLLLDLYLPAQYTEARRKNGRRLPGVIVIRGGGWMVHDKKRFAHVSSALAERGVATACIEYGSRLA